MLMINENKNEIKHFRLECSSLCDCDSTTFA